MEFRYRTKGTCSTEIILELDEDNIIRSVSFRNGCNGNAKGISALVVGRKAEEVIDALRASRHSERPPRPAVKGARRP